MESIAKFFRSRKFGLSFAIVTLILLILDISLGGTVIRRISSFEIGFFAPIAIIGAKFWIWPKRKEDDAQEQELPEQE